MLAGHVKHSHYLFSVSEAEQLLKEYKAHNPETPSSSSARSRRTNLPRSGRSAPVPELPADPGHRTESEWMGEPVVTLSDLLRPGLLAVVVGINPAPTSVAAGHYWQGSTGRTLWRRLRSVGLLPPDHNGYEDDAAFTAGVGFTDVVKRPTPSAQDLDDAELRHGLDELRKKLDSAGAPLVIFAFKKAATTLLGAFPGNGFLTDRKLGPSEVFVMPGPYESSRTTDTTLGELRNWVRRQRKS